MAGNLFFRICDTRTLWRAWEKVKEKGSVGGIDNVSIEIYERNLDKNLNQLHQSLKSGTYVPEPVKRIYIPKEKTDEKRAIGISCIKDRVAQQAVKMVIEPLFERTFLKCSFGFRPHRGPQSAIRQVERELKSGNVWITDLDIDNFFDCIDHAVMMSRLAEQIEEEPVLRLIELWLKMGTVEGTEWLDAIEGVPQGNIISPLMANVYLHPLDMEITSKNYAYIRYADDFVILCPSRDQSLQAFNSVASFLKDHLNLRLNEDNQPYRHVRDGFVFLGFFFKDKRKTISEAKIQKIKDRIAQILTDHYTTGVNGVNECIKKLNESIIGWRQYYSLGDTKDQFQFLDNILFYKLSSYLKRNMNQQTSTGLFRDAIYRVEFFSKKSAKEKERLLELVIAHSRITAKEKTTAQLSGMQIQPLPIAAAVEKKKKEYQGILTRNSDLVIEQPGSFAGKSSHKAVIIHKGKRIMEIPLFRLKGIFLLSPGIKISAVLIKYCAARQIPVHFIDTSGKTYAVAYNPVLFNFKPYPHQPGEPHERRSLQLAALLLRGKLKNQINLLQYFSRHEDIELEYKNECSRALKEMNFVLERLELSYNTENILELKKNIATLQGNAYSSYWRAVKALLHRYVYVKRRQEDICGGLVNSLLNFGTGILYSKVLGLTSSIGLNYYNNFVYKPIMEKTTLVYEVSSLFHQAVVDRIIFEMLRNNEKLEIGDLILSLDTRKKVALAVLKKLSDKIQWRGRRSAYSEIIRMQSLHMIDFIRKGREFEPFLEQYED